MKNGKSDLQKKDLYSEWFFKWFNQDYLNLYSEHDEQEAQQQVDFILQHIPYLDNGSVVLDLGCGAGRHAIIFAKKKIKVIGVDHSDFLLQEAQKKAKGLDVKFILADIKKLCLPERFDLIINMFTSFGYFASDQENEAIFKIVCSHLKENGYFFLDYLNPTYIKKNLMPEQTKEVKGEMIKIKHKIEDGFIIKTIDFPNRSYREYVKLYSHQALKNMLAKNGLELFHAWSDFTGQPWHSLGKRQLILCKKFYSS